MLGAIILTDPILDVIRRELRRLSPDVKIDTDDIKAVLVNDVMKRELLEGEKADEARKKISRATNNMKKAKAAKDDIPTTPDTLITETKPQC